MAAFLITSLAATNPALDAKVRATYTGSVLALSGNCWLISDKGVTTQEVCVKLDITNPENMGLMGQVVVVRIESYFGFAPTHVWEWLKAKGGNE